MKRFDILAGPNGCGKSTIAELLLKEGIIENFINADTIAKGLNSNNQEPVNVEAGKLMLENVHNLIEGTDSFTIETTLSGLIWKKIINKAKSNGFIVNIYFIILTPKELAVERVKNRVLAGGHNIPQEIILRRYERSCNNFYNIYSKIVDNWWVFDNSNGASEYIAWSENQEIFKAPKFGLIFKKFKSTN